MLGGGRTRRERQQIAPGLAYGLARTQTARWSVRRAVFH